MANPATITHSRIIRAGPRMAIKVEAAWKPPAAASATVSAVAATSSPAAGAKTQSYPQVAKGKISEYNAAVKPLVMAERKVPAAVEMAKASPIFSPVLETSAPKSGVVCDGAPYDLSSPTPRKYSGVGTGC